MSQKILVIGGASLVGSTFIDYAPNDAEIAATLHNSSENKSHNTSEKIDLIKDRNKISEYINKIRPEVVIHTVAFSSVDFCETNNELANLLHVEITKDITQACKETNSKLIYFSTDAVFDGKKNQKYSESEIPNPLSYYGQTKLNAEEIILNENDRNVVLRTTVIYGQHKRSRFTNWVVENLKNNVPVTAFTDQYNTPTLVDDLSKAIKKIIEFDITGLFHASGKTCVSRYDFAIKLAERFKLDKKLIVPTLSSEKKQLAPRPKYGCLDATKLENLIGMEFCDLDSGLSFICSKTNG
tara:strand:+ start:2343 stop:3233 length:891 start_codon:yes stop_codon:yes gene_type:complete